MTEEDRPTCLFGCGPAVARYAMDRGCIVYRDVLEQDLCAQHEDRATPMGSMTLIRSYV